MLSEVRKRTPHDGVAAWYGRVMSEELFVSVLTIGEIRQGVERLRRRDPVQTDVFEQWLEALKHDFADRIVPVSTPVAEAWGRLDAATPLPPVDGLLAASAVVHRLTLVTRDTGPFAGLEIAVLNPWEQGGAS